MTIWVDAQLSQRTAHWISARFRFDAKPLRDIGLRDAEDYTIFQAAKDANAIIITKDSDFVHLLEMHGSPPKILRLTCGNTSESASAATVREAPPRGHQSFGLRRKISGNRGPVAGLVAEGV